jgi:hypothetical protein
MVLTEGYDDPEVECIVVARPTKSRGLYIQMVGRGLRVDKARPWEEQNCLILDVVGASQSNDLRSILDLSEKPLEPKAEREGRKLTDLEDEFDAGEGVEADTPELYAGPVAVEDFDPLGVKTRSKVWLKTPDGTYFVPAGTLAFVFIMEYPRPGRWSVAWIAKTPSRALFLCPGQDAVTTTCVCGKGCKAKTVTMTEHRDLPLDMAMSWAEDLAVDFGAANLNTAGKSAKWRKKQPSGKLINMASGFGIRVPAKEKDPETGTVLAYSWNAGEVSDRITRIQGADRIDPVVRKVKS